MSDKKKDSMSCGEQCFDFLTKRLDLSVESQYLHLKENGEQIPVASKNINPETTGNMTDLKTSGSIKTEETLLKSPQQNSSIEKHLFTTSMLEEEKKLLAEGSLASDLVKQDGLARWQKISEDMRMTQLQHLLDKSSIYANYLLGVIEKDKEKQKRRAERRQKKHLKEQQNLAMSSTMNSKEENPLPNFKVTRKRKKNSIDETIESPAKLKKITKSKKNRKVESTTSIYCSHPRPNFEVGRKVKILHKIDNTEDDLHEGKIIDICSVNKEWKYLIHFLGRKKSEDKWVCKTAIVSDINDDSDEENNNNRASITLKKKEKEIAKINSQALFQSKLYLGKQSDNHVKLVNGLKYLNEKVISDSQPVLLSGGILRDYQIAGYEWLKILFDNAVNGILADEMGLGKTIQCIALISRLVKLGFPGPYLVCAPMSTICNWVTEFNRFSPSIPVMLYHGSAAERHILQSKIGEKSGNLLCCPVVVTSYEILIRDSQSLAKHSWDYLVIDEGHRLKNMNCRLIKELRKLKVNAKLLLTGTPLQNNLTELWSLLNFLLPEVFNDLSTFEAWFDLDKIQNGTQSIDSDKEKNVILMLHKILAPFLLRRTKADVSLSLPPKKELLVFVPLSLKQSEFYHALTNQTIMQCLKNKISGNKTDEDVDCKKKYNESSENQIDFTAHKTRSSTLDYRIMQQRDAYFQENETSVIKVSLNNVAMQLRKCCNHPYLIEYPLIPGTDIYRVDEDIVSSCGKLQLLDRMLPLLQSGGHKVLIFSQMTKILDILEDYCRFRSYNYVRLDGTTKCSIRKIMIDEYNNDSGMFIFLLSTRAGGLGINLTAADTVIIYDSDWNPQNDLQAQDRCHRIGQTRPVIVYRFVAANTVDQFMVERAEAKRVLERVVMNRSKFKGKLQEDITSDQYISGESMSILKMLQASVGTDMCAVKPISENNLLKILDRDKLINTSDVNIGCGLFRSVD